MAQIDRYTHGQFSWIDLMTPDVDAAAEFYGALFGWEAERTQDDAGGAYAMFRLGDDAVAGMGAMPDDVKAAGVPPHWNSYVTVDDADAAAARAQELGAELQMPVIDIDADGERVGRMSILVDPNGARISIWQPGNHVGSALANVPGTFCWNELCVRDVEGASKFYRELFGWEILAGDAENGYREIRVGERLNGGILPWTPEIGDLPPTWSVYFAVEDCDAAVAKVRELGGQLLMGPVDIQPGRFAVVCDNQGAVFNVMRVDQPDS
ncbi:MAG: VOC family protein [Proteobacteria bacterium]|nr:VOC family protein [Pseudomonadota bacterium]